MINLVIILLLIGAGLYLIRLVPIDDTIKTVIYVVVVLGVIIYILRNLGSLGLLTT